MNELRDKNMLEDTDPNPSGTKLVKEMLENREEDRII